MVSLALFSSVIQSVLNEGIAPRKMFNEILFIHIVHGDVQVLVVLDQGGFIVELPVNH